MYLVWFVLILIHTNTAIRAFFCDRYCPRASAGVGTVPWNIGGIYILGYSRIRFGIFLFLPNASQIQDAKSRGALGPLPFYKRHAARSKYTSETTDHD